MKPSFRIPGNFVYYWVCQHSAFLAINSTAATMKKLAISFGLVVFGLGSGCLEYPKATPDSFSGSLFRYHFVGGAALAQNTNAAKLRTIANLASTKAFRDQTLGKLARTPYEVWKKELPPGISDRAELLRPLLDDLMSAETFFELLGPTSHPESVLAIQVNEERAHVWQTNLWQLMLAWKLGTPFETNPEGFKGWEMKGRNGAKMFRFVRAGKWILFAAGPDKPSRWPELLQQVKKSGRPVNALETSWLDMKADCPRLRGWLPFFEEYPLPPAHLTVAGKGGNLRTEVQLRYSNPIPYKFEPWKIPTNTIQDPLISFTVGRGIAPLLRQVKGVPELGLKELPNQFCAWGQSPFHGKTYATFPLNDPTNFLALLAPKLSDFVKLHLPDAARDLGMTTNMGEISWRKLPFLVPYLRPIRESGFDYLMAGLLRIPPTTNPPPPELYAQFINRKNVLYYDWEITAERLLHSLYLQQLLDIFKRRRVPAADAASQKWLLEIDPHLMNTTTELTMNSPKDLALVRRSDLGFTGFELVTLTRWLDSPGFPLTFEPRPLMASLTNVVRASRTNSPTVSRTNSPAARPPVR